MMTYSRYQIPRAGPFSFVMSQDHTWSGAVGHQLGFLLRRVSGLGAALA